MVDLIENMYSKLRECPQSKGDKRKAKNKSLKTNLNVLIIITICLETIVFKSYLAQRYFLNFTLIFHVGIYSFFLFMCATFIYGQLLQDTRRHIQQLRANINIYTLFMRGPSFVLYLFMRSPKSAPGK